MLDIVPEPGSFRDPSGHIYEVDRRIFRTVEEHAAAEYEFVRDSGALSRPIEDGRVISSVEVEGSALGPTGAAARYVVEHPVIPFISYPYEWTFPMLKAAALLHLDLQLELLPQGITLSDASAYNVQFRGAQPVFIDMLSFRRYRDGEFWRGHRQFCEQFLNPLLLRVLVGIPFNGWYRGNLEGIPTADLARLLPLKCRLSWNVISQVLLQARLERAALREREATVRKAQRGSLSQAAFAAMLRQLRNWIAKLQPPDRGESVWGNYARTHSYASEEEKAKRAFVAEFVAAERPRMLWDLGCNTGEYSVVALNAGADSVVGFDFDQPALEGAFARAQAESLDLLPLFFDAANPSPDQGWMQRERRGLERRARADALLALAFEHHLAIGRNVPLDQVIDWLTGTAPCGVIEFVPKDDPTVRQMLALREDIFPDYTETAFTESLERRARIMRSTVVSASGRKLFWYDWR